MPEARRLISDELLSMRAFRRELERFLKLSPATLQEMNVLADSVEGLSPAKQTMTFAEKGSLAPDTAHESLRIAEHLYEECRENQINPGDAVEQLAEVAAKLSIEDFAAKRAALTELLSVKRGYESGRYAIRRTLAIVNHFEDIDGSWDLRPVFNRDTGEIIKLARVLLMSISWHDARGSHQSAVVQLDEDEWAGLKDKMQKLERQRQVVVDFSKRS